MGIGNERQIEGGRNYLISMGLDKGHLGRWTYKGNVNDRRGEKIIEARSMQHGVTRYKQGEWRKKDSQTGCMRNQSRSTSRRPPSDRPSKGNSFQGCKIKEGERTNPVESSSAGRGFFLVRVRRGTKFFDASPNSEQRQKGEQLRENKKRRW